MYRTRLQQTYLFFFEKFFCLEGRQKDASSSKGIIFADADEAIGLQKEIRVEIKVNSDSLAWKRSSPLEFF